MNPRPYFVPSTASASEILTNVAIQDLLENEDAGFYELSCHPTSTSTLASVSDSWDSFDFLVPSAYEDHSGSDSDLDLEPVDVEEGPVSPDDSPQSESATESTGSTPTSRFPGLGHSSVPSSANINNTRRLFSPSVVVVALWNARPDSPPGGNDCDDEEVIMVPSASFPHPHRLATIIEEEEDPPSPESDDEDEDDTSDTETIRPSSVLGCPGLPVDMGMDQPAWRYWPKANFHVRLVRAFRLTAECQSRRANLARESICKLVSPSLVSKFWLWTLAELMDSLTLFGIGRSIAVFLFLFTGSTGVGWRHVILLLWERREVLVEVLACGPFGRERELAFLWAGRAAFGVSGIVACDQTLVLGRTCSWLSCHDGGRHSVGLGTSTVYLVCKYRARVGVSLGWFRPTILVMLLRGSASRSVVQG
ncbi:hypothetical protein F5148DRAFT_388406 [Russula earlei]|uniref:Uncharacterized protein n=1 Tax=Russula earlei TaxID=71964 RepID=A0ACC0U022_9AGAM|nr:hypothetical protein F5148DRAFT_388406 [Russula earlei]